jgi:hypothetical protein
MGCRPKPAVLNKPSPTRNFQSRPTAIPAISKSTELQPPGQPVFAVAVACSFLFVIPSGICCCRCFCLSGCHPRRGSAVPVPSPTPKPQLTPTTRPKPCSPSVTIHHLPLDANPSTFYSLRIFDTLAPLANPVAVTKRTLCAATNPRFHLIQSPESFGSAVNPVPPDGGQHTT